MTSFRSRGKRPEGHVFYDLHVDSPEADHRDGPEDLVSPRACYHLRSRRHHLRHLDSLYHGTRDGAQRVVYDGLVGVDDLFLVEQVEHDTAGVALMENVL